VGVILLDPDSSWPIIILSFLLILHAFFATVFEAIASLRQARRLQLIEEEIVEAELIDYLIKSASHFMTTRRLTLKSIELMIVIVAVLTYTPTLVAGVVDSPRNWLVMALFIVATTAVTILVVGELIPREVGRNYAEPIALKMVYPVRLLFYLARPMARMIAFIGRSLSPEPPIDESQYGPDVITEDDLRTYVDASEEGGALNENEKDMIHSIFNLDDTVAREVMVPRVDMVAIEANASVMEALDVILEAGHSRLPVYIENVDNLIGILYAKDLLAHWREGGQIRPVKGLERQAYYVPETKPVSELLRELQERKIQIAMVVDEYGGVAGLVTIEDIVEEIVGEIQDEYDQDEFFMERISDDEFIFSARMDLDDINDLMSAELPTAETDTLGGLIYTTLGGVPVVGDTVDIDDLRLTVLNAEGRRIKRVKVQRFSNYDEDQSDPVVALQKDNPSRLVGTGKTVSESS
jgi:CBS domain containing-hemolysin-like protein